MPIHLPPRLEGVTQPVLGSLSGGWLLVLRLFNVAVFVHGFVPKWVVQPVLQRVTTLPHTVLLFGTFLVFCVNMSPVEAVQCGHCSRWLPLL